jgi:RimJ/RimL family protein N-acetyltransferase
MGFRKGETGMPAPPFGIFAGAQAVTLATQDSKQDPKQDPTQVPAQRTNERAIPVLETARLRLRAPRRGDVKAIVRLAGDRRVAENTARVPHPYTAGDAEEFIAAVNRQDGEASFMITLAGEPVGACGVEPRDSGAEIGYWLGMPFWGRGYATEAVRADRSRFRRSRP